VARRKKHNPERRMWQGRSHRKGKGGPPLVNDKTIRENRDESAQKADGKEK
jgi:hypothetical protein